MAKPKAALNARQYRGYLIIGGLVFVGVGTIIAFAKNRSTATVSAPPLIKPTYDASPDIDAKFVRFMNEVKDSLPEQHKRTQQLEERLAASEQLVRSAVGRIEEVQRSQEAKYAEQMRKLTQLSTPPVLPAVDRAPRSAISMASSRFSRSRRAVPG